MFLQSEKFSDEIIPRSDERMATYYCPGRGNRDVARTLVLVDCDAILLVRSKPERILRKLNGSFSHVRCAARDLRVKLKGIVGHVKRQRRVRDNKASTWMKVFGVIQSKLQNGALKTGAHSTKTRWFLLSTKQGV
jgi:hypothetical protein